MNSRNRMRRCLLAGGAALLIIVLGGVRCKLGAPNYSLSVVLAAGITGSPAAGQYTYKELTQVAFAYQAVDNVSTVEVFLNDKIRFNAGGTIVMYGDGYRLTADIVDPRGDWTLNMTQVTPVTNPVVTFTSTLTLTGTDHLSGTFIDSRGFNGTWTGSTDILILTYTDWLGYVLTGSVYAPSGSYTGSTGTEATTGTWLMTRKT